MNPLVTMPGVTSILITAKFPFVMILVLAKSLMQIETALVNVIFPVAWMVSLPVRSLSADRFAIPVMPCVDAPAV